MTINSTTRKTSNLVGNGNTHTYPFAFKVFQDSEIVVKKLEVSTSIETTLTLGANNDYIVTLNQDQNGNPGGSITLKQGGNNFNLPSGFQIVITSAVQSLQGTDLTNQGGFYPEVINDALDKSAILHQQQQDELDRSIKFSLTNTIGSLEITESATARANKVMAFDNAGEFSLLNEIGTYRGNWAASRAYVVRDLVKDTSTNNIFMCNAAHTSSGAQPLTTNTDSAKWDLIVDAATSTAAQNAASSSASAAASSATAAAASQTAAASSQTAAASSATAAASSASTASTKATQADTAKTAAQAAQTAAETALDSFDDRYLGAKSSNPTLDNDGNALIDGALYFNTTVNRMRVYDLGNTTWLEVTIFGSDLTNVNTVAGSINNVNTVAGSITGVNAVANNATNINAVNSNATNINAVAGAVSNINAVASNATNINTVASNISNVNAIAADITKIQTVANDLNETVSEIETAANDLNETTSEIDTVANAITNVDNVGNNIANVNTVAGSISNVNAVASNASNVNAVGGAITNVNNVGNSIANVNTVASNLSGVNSFAERYRTDNSGNNPSTSLNAGDLFYNQASGKLLVYNGLTSAWEETQSVGNFFINTIGSFSGTGGNSATFNNSAYKFTLSNAGQFAQQMLVSINGVVQKPNSGTGQPSEGFALDGANIVFSSPPPSGADYFIVTIGASVSIGTPSDNTVTSAKIVNGTIVNDDINASAAIAMSKLALSITNAEINASAAIAKSKLANLDIVNADINASAAIALTKLATSGTPNNTNFLRGDGAWTTVVTDLVNDSSPQLGGTLDTNGNVISFPDSGGVNSNRLKIGSGNDIEIFHVSNNSYFDFPTGYDTYFRAGTSRKKAIRIKPDDAVELYYNDLIKAETYSNGLLAHFHLKVQGSQDQNAVIQMFADEGDNTDDQFLMAVDATNNRWTLQGQYVSGWHRYIQVLPQAGVQLYYDELDNSNPTAKLNTTVNGVELGLSRGSHPSGAFGGGYYSDIVINNCGTASGAGGGSGVVLLSGNASWGGFIFADNDEDQKAYIKYNHSADDMYFGVDGGDKMVHNGTALYPAATNTYDLGTTSYRWRNIYTNDLNLSNEGGANDVDGTWGSFTIQEGAEDLFLINKRSGKKYKFALTEVS